LKTLIKVEASRTIKGVETNETRYYISDEEGLDAAYFNALVRGHWCIENHLHWHLDVTFTCAERSEVKKIIVVQEMVTRLKTFQHLENLLYK
jgi:predicted transposase YbfD/YdcC